MRQYGKDRSWPFAEGGGTTILVVSLLLAAAILLWLLWPNGGTAIFSLFAAGLWLLVLYFFRDPNRKVVDDPGLVVGPGDGEIVEISRERETRYLNADIIRISMFLSITDVHVQRVPLGGTIKTVDHQPGKFLQAFKPEASDVNEYIGMVIESEYGTLLVKQIAGILARRCVNYAKPGDIVTTGQRFGLIRFSSRIDLFLPANVEILASVGTKVYGGLTPIARIAQTNQ